MSRGHNAGGSMADTEEAWRELAHQLWTREQLSLMFQQAETARREQEESVTLTDLNEGSETEDDLTEIQSLQMNLILTFFLLTMIYGILHNVDSFESCQDYDSLIHALKITLAYCNLFLVSLVIFIDVLK